ncbi:hypothetical protein C7271_15835 [filamentous cyanobacterium CCP5]|nr:hypothetical protein C7271_15835 [filamentous cyanobacterium CCP5]
MISRLSGYIAIAATLTSLFAIAHPAQALIFKFESDSVAGTLEFESTGNLMLPKIGANTVITRLDSDNGLFPVPIEFDSFEGVTGFDSGFDVTTSSLSVVRFVSGSFTVPVTVPNGVSFTGEINFVSEKPNGLVSGSGTARQKFIVDGYEISRETVAFSILENTEAIPTPALLPGLVGMGVAALRKRKQEAEAEA